MHSPARWYRRLTARARERIVNLSLPYLRAAQRRPGHPPTVAVAITSGVRAVLQDDPAAQAIRAALDDTAAAEAKHPERYGPDDDIGPGDVAQTLAEAMIHMIMTPSRAAMLRHAADTADSVLDGLAILEAALPEEQLDLAGALRGVAVWDGETADSAGEEIAKAVTIWPDPDDARADDAQASAIGDAIMRFVGPDDPEIATEDLIGKVRENAEQSADCRTRPELPRRTADDQALRLDHPNVRTPAIVDDPAAPLAVEDVLAVADKTVPGGREIVSLLARNYTQAEIARQMGISARTVRRRIARIRKKIRKS